MKIRLKCGEVFDTELPFNKQNLSKKGVEEIMELLKRDKIGMAS